MNPICTFKIIQIFQWFKIQINIIHIRSFEPVWIQYQFLGMYHTYYIVGTTKNCGKYVQVSSASQSEAFLFFVTPCLLSLVCSHSISIGNISFLRSFLKEHLDATKDRSVGKLGTYKTQGKKWGRY